MKPGSTKHGSNSKKHGLMLRIFGLARPFDFNHVSWLCSKWREALKQILKHQLLTRYKLSLLWLAHRLLDVKFEAKKISKTFWESFEHQVASAGAWVAATKQSGVPE